MNIKVFTIWSEALSSTNELSSAIRITMNRAMGYEYELTTFSDMSWILSWLRMIYAEIDEIGVISSESLSMFEKIVNSDDTENMFHIFDYRVRSIGWFEDLESI